MNGPFVRSARSVVSIFLLCFFLPAGSARERTSPPQTSAAAIYDAQTFVQEIGRLKAEIEIARHSTEAVRTIHKSLPELWTVDVDGRVYYVPTELLGSMLAKAEEQPELLDSQLDRSRDYLDALADEAGSMAGQSSAGNDVESARSKLNAILARREFANAAQESWWDKFRARIYKFISDALDRLLSRVGAQKSLGRALLWIAVCAGAIFIAYWIFRLWFRAAKVQELALEAAAIPSRSWQEWIQAARAAASSADYRLAVHCAYWAGIARLQDLGALAPDRTKTPREYLRALTKAKVVLPETLADRQRALSLLTSRLEKTWYGFHPTTEDDFRDSLAQLETLGCHLP